MKRENPLVFYPRYLLEVVGNHFWMAYWLGRMGLVRQRIRREGDKGLNNTDLALTPPSNEEFADLALFADTRGGTEAVDEKLKEIGAREVAKSAAE